MSAYIVKKRGQRGSDSFETLDQACYVWSSSPTKHKLEIIETDAAGKVLRRWPPAKIIARLLRKVIVEDGFKQQP